MFIWLENTSVAVWVSTSYYAYPALLSIHIVGLAIVVGLFSMRDLKLLGLFAELPLEKQSGLGGLALAGFSLNLLSGLLLFSSQASYLITSVPFLIKISLILSGMVVAMLIQSRIKKAGLTDLLGTLSDSLSGIPVPKTLAVASLLIWSSAIIAGRLIAYV